MTASEAVAANGHVSGLARARARAAELGREMARRLLVAAVDNAETEVERERALASLTLWQAKDALLYFARSVQGSAKGQEHRETIRELTRAVVEWSDASADLLQATRELSEFDKAGNASTRVPTRSGFLLAAS